MEEIKQLITEGMAIVSQSHIEMNHMATDAINTARVIGVGTRECSLCGIQLTSEWRLNICISCFSEIRGMQF